MGELIYNAPLVIRREEGRYSVLLNGMEIAGLIRSNMRIEWTDDDWSSLGPEVTVTFMPGALDLDIDDELIRYLDEKREREQPADSE